MPFQTPHLDTPPVVKMFEVLPIVRINKCMGLWGILNFRLLRDAFPYWLASGIPLREGVP
jgi:hypothetical protein